MKTVVNTLTVDDDELALLREPKSAPALERATGDDVFELAEGPFYHYRRVLDVGPGADGRHDVVETTEFQFAIPVWGIVFRPLMRWSIKHPPAPGKAPWWVPPDRMDARSAEILALLCTFSYIAGYLGVLLGQLNPYIRADFGASEQQIADAQSAVRIGALIALVVVTFADRVGRRRILLLATYAALVLAATGALTPSLGWLGLSQGVARAFSAAVGLLVLIVAAEEMPAGARAFAVSVTAMTAGLGAGGVLFFLPLADLTPWAWRGLFVFPLVFLIPAIRYSRRLPESKRYEVLERQRLEEPDEVDAARPARRRAAAGRFVMVGAVQFFFYIFLTPVGATLNEFLKTEQHFSGLQISLFQALTNGPPGAIAIVVGGQLADKYGRRLIGIIGVLAGTGFTVLMFYSSGPMLWLCSALATLLGAAVIPALGVYQNEMFGTGRRGRANGGIYLLVTLGSVVGLKGAAYLKDNVFDGLQGPSFATLAFAPLVVAAIVLIFYPETVHKELEELNPEDLPPPEGAELEELDAWHRRHEAETHAHLHLLHHDDPHDGSGDADATGSTGSIGPRA